MNNTNNRELKFRYYDAVLKKMVHSSEWNDSDNPLSYFFHSAKYFAHETIVQQYIGVKDKEGKEIYEGDIVKYNVWQNETQKQAFEKTSLVTFSGGGFYPRYINDVCEDEWYSYGIDVIEIIGNIFETPELIK